MHFSGLDSVLWAAGTVGQILLLCILFKQRLHRLFPIFTTLIVWSTISDPLLLLFRSYYFQAYYSFSIIQYCLELSVLVEIAANVIRPVRRSFPRGILFVLLGAMLLIGVAAFFFAARANAATLAHHRTFIVMDTTVAILRLVTFLLIAGCSQILGLGWKNYVLQLASGLAFYSVVMLIGELAQSQLRNGPSYPAQYTSWSELQVAGYLCSLYYWCYSFARKEAPRKEFSPQMAQLLVSISGSAKRQHSVVARSVDIK
jgi:hypothetical protein